MKSSDNRRQSLGCSSSCFGSCASGGTCHPLGNAPTVLTASDYDAMKQSASVTSEKNGTTAGTPAPSKVVPDAALGRTLTIHADERGNVRETLRASWFPKVPPIVQLVQSESEPGVMRAMHAHKLQWDVWHLTRGTAFVQLYDHTLDHNFSVWLEPTETIFIPPGLSHGFYTPTGCTLIYGLTREYDGTDEYEWNAYDDEYKGARNWPFPRSRPIRSDRDKNAPSLREFIAAW